MLSHISDIFALPKIRGRRGRGYSSYNFSRTVLKASTRAALKSPRTCEEIFEFARGDGGTQANVLALSTDSENSDEGLLGVWWYKF